MKTQERHYLGYALVAFGFLIIIFPAQIPVINSLSIVSTPYACSVSFSPSNPQPGQAVTFTVTNNIPANSAVLYLATFGDGVHLKSNYYLSYSPVVFSHAYSQAKTYYATVYFNSTAATGSVELEAQCNAKIIVGSVSSSTTSATTTRASTSSSSGTASLMTPSSGYPGLSYSFKVAGLPANYAGTLVIKQLSTGIDTTVATFTTNGQGAYSGAFTIPSNMPAGSYSLHVENQGLTNPFTVLSATTMTTVTTTITTSYSTTTSVIGQSSTTSSIGSCAANCGPIPYIIQYILGIFLVAVGGVLSFSKKKVGGV